jgi:hypothetical protein
MFNKILCKFQIIGLVCLGLFVLLVIPVNAHEFPPQQVIVNKLPGSSFQVLLTTSKVDLVEATKIKESDIIPSNIDLNKYFLEHIKFKYIEDISWKINLITIDNLNEKELLISLFFEPSKVPSSNNYKLEYTAIIKEVPHQEAIVSINAPFYQPALAKINSLKYVPAEGKLGIVDVNYSTVDSVLDILLVFKLGIFHILGGIDHLLFLLIILLGSKFNSGKEQKSISNNILSNLKPTFISSAKIVGLYTIGHTISLILAAMGYSPLPAYIIEVLVAITLFITAGMALLGIHIDKNKWIVVLFGLIHGFAFSEVLTTLSIVGWQFVGSIVSFNLGIEFIQLVLIIVTTPIILWLTNQKYYTKIFRVLMIMVMVLSIFWTINRIMGR